MAASEPVAVARTELRDCSAELALEVMEARALVSVKVEVPPRVLVLLALAALALEDALADALALEDAALAAEETELPAEEAEPAAEEAEATADEAPPRALEAPARAELTMALALTRGEREST